LAFWQYRSAEVFRALTQPTTLSSGDLFARFQSIAAASAAPQPRFEVVALHGGAIANAIALPSLRGASVVYTDTILRLLDADKAAAITGHEIAHLEYFDAARLRRLNAIMTALIVAGAGVALLPRFVPVVSPLMVGAGWGAACVLALAWLMRDWQRNETAS